MVIIIQCALGLQRTVTPWCYQENRTETVSVICARPKAEYSLSILLQVEPLHLIVRRTLAAVCYKQRLAQPVNECSLQRGTSKNPMRRSSTRIGARARSSYHGDNDQRQRNWQNSA